ncbi:MAG: lipocalin family protein [Methylophilaceae bacterium]
MKKLFILLLSFSLFACMGVPQNVTVVNGVNASQYLGTWYEIARLDHSFERGLEQVTASYSKNADGSIKVINRGFNTEKQVWKEAEGKAYFVEKPNADGSYIGKLKVSFFGPFYGAYNIIALDKSHYDHVMICGPDKDYLWILSRKPALAEPIKQALVDEAKKLGFATEKIIYVKQN